MRSHSRFAIGVWFLAIAGFPVLVRALPPAPPSLGAAASFAVLGGPAVTSSGSTIVPGNPGVGPGNTMTGFPPGTVRVGDTFRNDSTARQAQKDAAAAYDDLAGRACDPGPIGANPPANTTYCVSSFALAGPVTLAANNPDDVWIFKIAGPLTSDPNAAVLLINGAKASNVFWQVGGSVTLGEGTVFAGTVLALGNITLDRGATLSGRALAQAGAVTLDTNDVSLCCDPITISPSTLPDGIVGTPYTVPFAASGGIGLYTFKVFSGQPPPPLAFSPIVTNVLSGTPSAAGSYTFTVVATDAHGCTGFQTYTVKIVCTPDIIVHPSALPPTPAIPYPLPPATACVPYMQTFGATGGTAPYTFSLSATRRRFGPGTLALPNGVLTWTPAESGKYTFIVTATDKYGCSGSQVYDVVVVCETISISPATLPDGQVCAWYNEAITAAGCDPPYVLSLDSGMLPPGLTGPTPGNAITGMPSKCGTYHFTIKATDADDAECFTTRDYTIHITCPVITISPPVLPPASCGRRYCVNLTASCLIGTTLFSVTGGALPPGLPLSPDGMLCGWPSAGTYTWTVTSTDTVSGCTGSITYTLVVPGVVITPPTLPGAVVGIPYNETLTASGGTAPYTFSISGAPPTGLTFMQTTPATATISGTPTTNGVFNFCITVTDSSSPKCTAMQCYPMNLSVGGAPTLSGWGMIVLSILLVGAGFVIMRRGGI
jgi:hypothetical protein